MQLSEILDVHTKGNSLLVTSSFDRLSKYDMKSMLEQLAQPQNSSYSMKACIHAVDQHVLHGHKTYTSSECIQFTGTEKKEAWYNLNQTRVLSCPDYIKELVDKCQRDLDLSKLDTSSDVGYVMERYMSQDDGEFLPDRHENGLEKCFSNRRRVLKSRKSLKFVHLLISCSYSAMVKAEEITNRAVLVASMVDSLETMGYRCKVSMTACGSGASSDDNIRNYNFIVKFKDYSDHLDKYQLANMSSSMFLRYFCFSIQDLVLRNVYSSRGYPNPTIKLEPFMDLFEGESIIQIPSQIITEKGIFSLMEDFLKSVENKGLLKEYENRF